MERSKIYEDIAQRTNGDVYIGVVGPVRTGKSTFIKRFMETLVIPKIDNVYRKERARDELPQSGSGKTIMTAEPKFIPEEAVDIALSENADVKVRLIDCVGYMVDGALGQFENGQPRMVTTPWMEGEMPMVQAAELGTKKVISDHSTIGLVITTDGTITEFERQSYIEAEQRVIAELKEIGKPFSVVVNSVEPNSPLAQSVCQEISQQHNVTCITANCMELDEAAISEIVKSVLYEFPVSQLDIFMPAWVDALPKEHDMKCQLYKTILDTTGGMKRIKDINEAVLAMTECENITDAQVIHIDLGKGVAQAKLQVPRELFYQTIGQESGFEIADDGDLMRLLTELSVVNAEYKKIEAALTSVKETGYGIVTPTSDELSLEQPEIVRQGGRYGVRLKASAPSIHMIKAEIQTEVSPIVGSERQSEELVHFLLSEFDSDPDKIWQSNIFGKSLYDLVSEGLNAKLKKMPTDAQNKLQDTLQRIINEGSGGLICIIL